MDNLLKVGETQNVETMTSLQIAVITGKQHAHVMRDIRQLIEQGLNPSNFGLADYTDAKGQQRPMFQLTKKGSLILASGYNALLREKIIDRWEELENMNAPKIPQTYAEALMLAAQQAQQIEQQRLLIETQAPKVEFFDAVADSKTAIPMNDVAKVLALKGYGRNKLFDFLRTNSILMSNNRPYQKYIDSEHFRVVETRFQKHGEECVNIKTLVYQKGVDMIRKMILKKYPSKNLEITN